jgi:hypothetical protein
MGNRERTLIWLLCKKAQSKAVTEYRKAKKKLEKKLTRDIKKNPKSFYAYVRSKTEFKDT